MNLKDYTALLLFKFNFLSTNSNNGIINKIHPIKYSISARALKTEKEIEPTNPFKYSF